MNRDPLAWARLGQKLKQARLARGLKQSDIATEADVSLASVQSAEAGTVPKSRMPITLPPIAAALGWKQGSVDAVLDGGEPDLEPSDSEWRTVPVEQQQIDEEQLAGIMTNAMVRATEHATAAEIRAATRIALDELRRQGYLPETNSVQPSTTSENR
ncbi:MULTISPECIES: helix-turn-helix domain-containing protein [unclassified Streptomyces]|uniref:helix-turn-helix domain-containing protein n=1 Tax=unclassified Streptomyces TaxID=2593676 RepID=UPI000978E632|nr:MULTISPECIES: helix-turn-helix transcriptional regulator [unclassified Streptomyces]ONI48675.1 anaerobic benzoate catabolism transcriptional regulator [Streptomyces sp. IB2014 011-1]RDV48206.1 XRE family transcriptional regulator [Streptomyces sp. IB2014 011-12]